MGIDLNQKWVKSGTSVLASEYPPQQPNTISCTTECGMRINLFPNRTIQSVTLIDYVITGRPFTLNLCLFNSSNIFISNSTTTTASTTTRTTTTTTTQSVAVNSCINKIKPVFISNDYTTDIFNSIYKNITNISIGKLKL